MKQPDIIFFGSFPFPSGSAAAARIRNLALGLAANDRQVHVMAMAPMYVNQQSGNTQSLTDEITYETLAATYSPSKQTPLRNKTLEKPAWLIRSYSATFRAYRLLKGYIQNGKLEFCVGYGRSGLRLLPLVKLCRRYSVTVLLDVVEVSHSFSGWGGQLNPLYYDWLLGERRLPLNCNGVIAITDGLAKIYRQLGQPNIITVPSIEGWEDDTASKERIPDAEFQLLYVGALLPRDAPDILMAIVQFLVKRGVRFRLNLVGKFLESDRGREQLAKLTSDPTVAQTINIVGRLDDEGLQQQMALADGLILTRRDDEVERCAFPTRLVEYLRHGVPVFVSDVGDISNYLHHMEHAVLLPPNDPELGTQMIQEVIDRPSLAAQIGRAGRTRGQTVFNRTTQAKRIIEFVADINA